MIFFIIIPPFDGNTIQSINFIPNIFLYPCYHYSHSFGKPPMKINLVKQTISPFDSRRKSKYFKETTVLNFSLRVNMWMMKLEAVDACIELLTAHIMQ